MMYAQLPLIENSDTNASPDTNNNVYALKAAYVMNFCNFITWPKAVISKQKKFTVGTLNPNVYQQFQTIFVNKDRNGLPIEIIYIDPVENIQAIKTCQVLFIDNHITNIDLLLATVLDIPILTISDDEIASHKDSMIKLIKQKRKLRFSINQKKAKSVGLTISAKLLRIAK